MFFSKTNRSQVLKEHCTAQGRRFTFTWAGFRMKGSVMKFIMFSFWLHDFWLCCAESEPSSGILLRLFQNLCMISRYVTVYWAALSLSFCQISKPMLMNIIDYSLGSSCKVTVWIWLESEHNCKNKGGLSLIRDFGGFKSLTFFMFMITDWIVFVPAKNVS